MKKISLLVMMLVVLLSVFAIEVSAEYYVNEEFTEDLSGLSSSTGGGTKEWADGALKVYAVDADTGAVCEINATSNVLPENVTVCFDYKLGATGARPTTNVFTGFCRVWISPKLDGIYAVGPTGASDENTNTFTELAAAAEKWYSVMIRFKNTGGSYFYDLYRKDKGSSEPYQKYISDFPAGGNDRAACFQIEGKCDASVDNIKFYEGIFASGTEFKFDEASIESVASIGNGTLKASTKLVSDVLDATKKATAVLAFYNKNDRLISCSFVQNENVIFGENEVEITVDTSSFYDKLGGGYGVLYFIDDFENLEIFADQVELK